MTETQINVYNGILNDYSLRRYTTNWSDLVAEIMKQPGQMPRTNRPFLDSDLEKLIQESTGRLKDRAIELQREISINKQTLNDKWHQKKTR